MLLVYSVADGMACPFTGAFGKTVEATMARGADILKVKEDDWLRIDEHEAEDYIAKHARNRCYPSKYERVIEAEGKGRRGVKAKKSSNVRGNKGVRPSRRRRLENRKSRLDI
jgi:hypothetical protein